MTPIFPGQEYSNPSHSPDQLTLISSRTIMDSINDPIKNLVDFDGFDEYIRVIADRHLFDNGPDLFAVAHSHQTGGSLTVPGSANRVELSAHITPEGFDIPQFADRNFFDHNLELFPDQYHDADLTDFAPIDQSISQFVAQQDGRNLGMSIEPAQPTMSQMPALPIQPAMMLSQAQASPQIVLATFEEQQQWQAFKSQQTQFYHPQPQVPQFQRTEAPHRWDNANGLLRLALQSPFESPVDELFLEYVDPEAPSNPRQTVEPSQQDFLSEEQIQLLQNAEPGACMQPLADIPPTDAVFPHSQLEAEPSPKPLSTRGRRSVSSRISSPEPTPQAAPMGLSFSSLDEATRAMPSRSIENAWEAPSDDPTIPTTQDQRAKYVLDMLEAFQNCAKCKDNKNGNTYLKRWYAGPGSYYNLLAMEKVCWHMLDIAERLHREGPQSTNMYCEEALKKLKTSRDMTFQQRIHHVCAMLKYSKYLCDQLMKGEGLEALVGAPKLKMAGATTMQVQNTRRQKWIIHGRTEDLHHSNRDKNEADEQDHVGEVRTPQRKTKIRQQTKQPARTKPRAKPKAGPADTSRDETDDDEEAAYRRQSNPGIFQAGCSPDIEMYHEPQQVIAAVLQIPTPLPPLKARHNHRESLDTSSIASPASVSSRVAARAPPLPSSEPTFQSSVSSTLSSTSFKSSTSMSRAGNNGFNETVSKNMRKKEDALLTAYRAALKASNISAEAKPAAQKTHLAPSTTKKVPADKIHTTAKTTKISSKIKTKTGTRKSRVDLIEAEANSKRDEPTLKAKRKRTTTELLEDDDQPTPKAKRQRTTKELFAEWMIRNDGSNEDDL